MHLYNKSNIIVSYCFFFSKKVFNNKWSEKLTSAYSSGELNSKNFAYALFTLLWFLIEIPNDTMIYKIVGIIH